MQDQYQFGNVAQAGQQSALQQNRVLRNTYMLLALSMVPTVPAVRCWVFSCNSRSWPVAR